jgi:hypothetical protein
MSINQNLHHPEEPKLLQLPADTNSITNLDMDWVKLEISTIKFGE